MLSALPRPILLLGAAAMLSGCVAQGEFPSLAPRPVELTANAEQAAAAEPSTAPNPVDPEVATRITALLADARRGEAAFEARLPAATSTVGSAGDAGSERWISAQQAISRLESARAPTVVALAELDRLAIASAGTPNLEVVTAAVAEARRLMQGQSERIESLVARLNPI